jgi:hypothetical protein
VADAGFDPSDHVGETVSFEATAMDAAGGAMVMAGAGTPVYIGGLARWPKELARKRVAVTGRLRRRESQVPETPPGGIPAHGIASASYVLDDARWEAA